MAESTIRLEGVSKRFNGIEAVRELTLEVPAGECLALVGHNGAGKTTAMKLMLGLVRPSAGRISVLGEDPCRSRAVRARRGVGFLPENVAFDAIMTGREVLAFFARLRGVPREQVGALLERVGLAEAAERRVKTYSKGMRQRLGLAQALLGSPRILLLDEPTSGLDPALRNSFYRIIRDLCRTGTTVLLSSHALTELEAQTDRVAIMNRGRLAACDGLAALSRRAGLVVRVRVSVPAGKAGSVARRLEDASQLERVNDHAVELSCAMDEKMDLLRRITALGPAVTDVEVVPPTFDEVYAHFSREEESR
jgi:Cu-processing system ATP-binding protein